MSTFIFAANAVLPIITIIYLGYWLRQKGFYDAAFLKIANKFVFRVALPTYLFYNVYSIESFDAVNWGIVLYSSIFVVLIFLVGMLSVCLYTKDNKKRGTLTQCTFRSNYAIIGVTLAEAMGGSEAVGVAAVISAFGIPLFNILAVVCLTVFNDEESNGIDVKQIFKSISKNPLIIGVFLGIIILVIRHFIPVENGQLIFSIQNDIPFLYKTIKNVGSIASPFALIILGGQFTFSAVKHLAKDIAVGTLWRLVLAPVIGIGGLLLLANFTDLFTVSNVEIPALIALYSSPVAVSSAIMAEEMNSHGELARQLVVWTSLFSILTMFLAVFIFKSFGLV